MYLVVQNQMKGWVAMKVNKITTGLPSFIKAKWVSVADFPSKGYPILAYQYDNGVLNFTEAANEEEIREIRDESERGDEYEYK